MGLEFIVLFVAVVTSLVIGGFVYSRNPNSATNRLFFFFNVAAAGLSILNTLSLHQDTSLKTLQIVRWEIFFASLYSFFLFYTIHTFPSAKIRLSAPARWLSYLATTALLILTQTPLIFSNMIGTGSSASVMAGTLVPFFALVNGFYILGSIAILFKRHSQASGVVKAQIQYLLVGVITSAVLIFVTDFIFVVILNIGGFLAYLPLYTLFFVLATAYAIVAHHLFDIRLIIKRTVVYSGLLLFTLGSYSMIVFLLTTILGGNSIGSSLFAFKPFLANLAAAIFIALGFEPIRLYLTRVTDNFLFKAEYEQQVVLKSLTHKLNDVVALDEALEIMMQTIVKVLHLEHAVTFVLQQGDNGQTAIKRIKQIGYTPSAKLILDEHDFSISFFTDNPNILVVHDLARQVEREAFDLDRKQRLVNDHRNKAELSAFIREHAIKQSVLKKLESLKVAVAVPLQLNDQPIGLIFLSDKLSGDIFFPEDLELLETIGAQAISSIQKAKLYEGDQMKTEFVSIASHELLTPVSAIEGYLSMILDENIGKIDDQARGYLEKVYSSAKRLSNLIKDLLSASRIEADRMKFEPQSLDMDRMVTEAIDQLKFVAQGKKIELIYKAPTSSLPTIWADPDRVTQILMNLIGNAIKYTMDGSVTVAIKQPAKDRLDIEIQDTGIGMTKKEQAHLFEKFYRVDSPETTGIIGTGLGLYITKSIIEKMGGTISIKSAKGEGTTFTFTLPLFKVEMSHV